MISEKRKQTSEYKKQKETQRYKLVVTMGEGREEGQGRVRELRDINYYV